jgi:sugar lactone lactonase YvrE
MQIEHAKPKSIGQLLHRVRERAANDDLVVELILPTVGLQLDGERLPNLPNSVLEMLQTSSASGIEVLRDHRATAEQCPWVVSGVKMVTLFIDSDEKNKTGEAPTPGTTFPGRGGWSDIFMTGMWFGDDYGYDYESTWHRVLASPVGPLLWPDRLRALAAGDDIGVEMPPMPSWEELQALTEEGFEDDSFGVDLAPGAHTPGKKTKAIGRPPGIWVESTQKDFAKGKFTNTVVSDDGAVRLWARMDEIRAPTDLCLWAQARGIDGTVYVGAWGHGTIYRPNGQGGLEDFAVTDAAAITALAAAPDGTLYAASYPGGKIRRVDAEGQVSDFCRLESDYVWAMAFDAAGDCWVAAGSPAGVFRIDGNGRAVRVFQPPDRHAIAMVAAPEGGVYVGTYPQGRVYLVEPSGTALGVFEAPSAAVQCLALDQQGNLYVGTSPTAFVYRIAPNGMATELLKAREKHVMALAVDSIGRVYAALGQKGKVYCIAPDRSVGSREERGVSAVTSLAIAEEAVSLCGVGATRFMSGWLDGHAEGAYTSSVHDAGAPARWGGVSWLATDGDGDIELFTRTGNTMLPDQTWSAWEPVRIDGEAASVASPSARYIQYRIAMRSDHAAHAPALQRVELIYMSKNQPPSLSIKSPQSGDVWSGKRKVRWSADDPDKDRLTYSVFYSGDNGESWTEIKGKTEESTESEPTEDEEPGVEEEMLDSEELSTRKPSREDVSHPTRRALLPSAGGGALRPAFDDEFDSEFGDMSEFGGGGDEFSLEEDGVGDIEDLFGDSSSALGSKDMEWDTTKVPDGVYLLKAVATDSRANPDDPLTVERVSGPVRVDNTPPKITGGVGEHLLKPPRSLVISDKASRVASVEYRVDKAEWHAAAAVDGIFDSRSETITINPSVLLAGRHVIELRMRDGAGNEATESIGYFLSRAPEKTSE